jgi:CHAT domain-containing protein
MPLKATRDELATVRDSFEQTHPDADVKALRGADATEGRVKELAPNFRYLHLATHGFFAPPSLRSALAPEAKPGKAGSFGDKGVAGFHPGLLSGLALAGANREPWPGEEDGILTALEVAELDLGGVELATLSACETGLGAVAGGEGVLGLQRAFQAAGARTVVASLWSVDDEATRKLMVEFYDNLWQKNLPKLEALQQAQLWMLREGRKRNLVPLENDGEKENKQRPVPPFYWAAFVLSGDWR